MHTRKRLIILLCIMIFLSISVGGILTTLLYKTAIDEAKERLVVSAKSQARLIEAIAKFDALHSQHDHPEGATAATLSQIVDAHKHYKGFGRTGEFTLAKREKSRIIFLLDHRHYDLNNLKPIPFESKLAEPMRLALSGYSGTIIGLDYRGEVVLAAYEPVKELNWGIVAKIDLSEIQEPFIKAGMIGGGAAIVLVIFGTFFFLRISESVLIDLEAKNKGLQQEVNERKRAEERLRLNQQTLENMSEGVNVVRESDWSFIYINPPFERIFGYNSGELIGKNVSLINAPAEGKSPDDTRDNIISILKETGAWEGEVHNIKKDGSPFWTYAKISTFEDTTEGPVLITVQEDITERKQIENELKEWEQQLFRFIEAMPIGVFVLTGDGQPYYANKTAQTILGKGIVPNIFPDELAEVYQTYYRGTDDLYPGEKLPAVRALAGVTCIVNDIEIHQGEEIIPIEVHATPIFNDNEEVIFGIAVFQDVTEREGMEKQLHQSQKMEALGTLAGGIAHDFNNMLAVIMGYANLFMSQLPEEDSSGRAYLETILEAGNRSTSLVKQILTFSRMDVTQPKPLNICLVVTQALQMLRSTIPINIEIKQEIPTSCRNILADKTQFHQVVVNLITNAFHAMEEEGGVIEVTLKEQKCETCSVLSCPRKSFKTCMQLAVQDSGYGISQEDREKVFDPFFTTKEVGKGTGLGLAVVYSIVRRHNGIIDIDSEVNKGTTVKICLPLIEGKEEEKNATANLTKAERSAHLLLVEDESSLAKMYEEFLKNSGYIVTVCTDGSAALKLFKENPSQFDLVLTDQAMPNMTGKQLSQALLKIRQDIPIILSTGYSSVISEESADTIGIRKYLMKPINLSTLQQAINDCLS